MNDIIKLLPDSVANQIAAGEVIQRPASVIKELVENAIDAGANIIKINIKDAGRTLIQVIDNGCGMSPTDARLAFERHSTSKITQADDLYTLHTMGFRGEALASICAVAEVEMRTMRPDDNIGTRIVICGSKVDTQEPAVFAPGTVMSVRKLFFNVPARRKFLKSDHIEMSHILREFERLALVNPEVEMQLTQNDVVVHQLLKGSFKQRIVELFGKSLDKQLVPVSSDTPIVGINGFISRPEHARRRGALQYLMVNGRNMRHPYFHKAIMQCYEHLIPADTQPNYFISFTVDPETIDVNIHPTKNEIKFENEQPIWQILSATLREGLGKFNAVPSIDFDTTGAPDIPVFAPDAGAEHSIDLKSGYNPFVTDIQDNTPYNPLSTSTHTLRPSAFNDSSFGSIDEFRQEIPSALNFLDSQSTDNPFAETEMPGPQQEIRQQQIVDAEFAPTSLQIKGKYIITPAPQGLMIINQHRAHVAILYERYLDLSRLHAFSSQKVIFPEIIDLSASQNAIMEAIAGHLEEMGFDIAPLGNSTWSVNGLPSVLDANINPTELIAAIIDTATDSGDPIDDSIWRHVSLTMAKASAIRSGQTLSSAEMEHLVGDLFKLHSPAIGPDGNPVFKLLSLEELEV